MSSVKDLTVLFDDSCPLCRWEVGMYRKMESLKPIEWRDISRPDVRMPAGLDQAAALRRFHVIDSDGEVYSGGRAFVELWRRLPGWRWLAAVFRIPGSVILLEGLYRLFLNIRPQLQRGVCRLPNSGGPGHTG